MAQHALKTITGDLDLKVMTDALDDIRGQAEREAYHEEHWPPVALPARRLRLPIIEQYGEEAAIDGLAFAWDIDPAHARAWLQAVQASLVGES